MAAMLRSTVSLKASFNGSKVEQKNVKAAASRSFKTVASLKAIKEAGKTAAASLAATAFLVGGANALTFNELQNLTYLQVKGTGVANTCPVIEGSASPLSLRAGNYKVGKMCLEPTSFKVKEESQFKSGEEEFVDTKLMTRLTYTLDEISGSLSVGGNGDITFTEEDGIDYAAVTVQLPGGERVPFLFSVKELVAKGNSNQFGGDFSVPSYRGATFLDPKGRGAATGYDNAVALPAASDAEEFEKENIKSNAVLKGSAVFNVAKFDAATGEVAGVFESIQPSDTDMGAKAPKDIKITGLWYGQIS
eukprot:CAMPEP_0196570584 /NCGR_PEP_ID=MMETSP1081-20130531/693_1 /TAXON_ID=36882 /ORGANISM="Pyramimonas amylifera, Strain CCMP720" /LENGTH=304 /DNA_ID=CAMNT_0041887113 /DNA_START=93 /DNA_END=1007 /DNA_ORIENTATION=-